LIAFSKKIIYRNEDNPRGELFFTVEKIVYRWETFSLVGI
jgi:hypothetical protein